MSYFGGDDMFHDFGRTMMVLGGMLFVIGALIHFGGKILPLGNLPGDFHWQSGNTSFSFPFASSIIMSIVLTILANLFMR